MGMTIDKAINTINNHSMSFASSDEEAINAIQFLMDVAKKYQKIEQIRHRVKHTDLEPAKAYELINEVLENGNVD